MTGQVLVTGTNGQLGLERARAAWPEGWEVVALDRAELDLIDPAAIAAKIAERPWAAVINAAYTAVDKAEGDILDELIGVPKSKASSWRADRARGFTRRRWR